MVVYSSWHRLRRPPSSFQALLRVIRATRKLSLRGGKTDEESQILKLAQDAPHLRVFRCSAVGSDSRLHELCSLVAHSGTLRCLNLSQARVTDDDLVPLCEALKRGNVTVLDLCQNLFRHRGAAVLANLLKEPDCRLELLNLSCNKLGARGVASLAAALLENSNLLELRVASIGARSGISSLVDALHHNSTLQSLDITSNSIPPSVSLAVCQMLNENSSLTNVDLREAPLQSDSIIALSRALGRAGSRIQQLDLSKCFSGNTDLSPLAAGFLQNNSLQDVRLDFLTGFLVGKDVALGAWLAWPPCTP